MRIMVINNATPLQDLQALKEMYQSFARSESRLDITGLRQPGYPESTEYLTSEMMYVPKVVQAAMKAERDKYDALFLACFLNPGLRETREAVSVPVVGAGEASMMLASTLGRKFSVVATVDKVIPIVEDQVKLYGISSKLASVRSIDLSVTGFGYNLIPGDKESEAINKVTNMIEKVAKKAINEDGAEVIVLGCAGLLAISRELQKRLGVPVLDSGVVGLKMTELMAELNRISGLSHSKLLMYLSPPKILGEIVQ